MKQNNLNNQFKISRMILGEHAFEKISQSLADQSVADFLNKFSPKLIFPDYIPELMHLENLFFQTKQSDDSIPIYHENLILNPSLKVVQSNWQLAKLFHSDALSVPQNKQEWVLIWRDPKSDLTKIKAADQNELLAIKIIAEDMPLDQVVASGKTTKGQLHETLTQAVQKRILIGPRSKIHRNTDRFQTIDNIPIQLIDSPSFTLQWHITHACDLNCKHCYDRSKRSPLTLNQGKGLLDDLVEFCIDNNVSGHVCFTGGNPFMYPHFFELYQAAADRGFSTSILGNPTPRKKIRRLVQIQKPNYFQTSLEGLPVHNDSIRGKGHFGSVIEFLGVLRDFNIPSTIMLTLTKDNMGQVLNLADRLRGHADLFTFNRLSQTGEGKNLPLPDKKEYAEFLHQYVAAARDNSIIGFKDNLINIVLNENHHNLFSGCTGFGCGAAFNFIAVLPDGEAHACRKFPSPIGNVISDNLSVIYDSNLAQKYRIGSESCRGCAIHSNCGGCMAITKSYGREIFSQIDPHCFI